MIIAYRIVLTIYIHIYIVYTFTLPFILFYIEGINYKMWYSNNKHYFFIINIFIYFFTSIMTILSHLTRFKNQVGPLPGKHAWNSRCEQQQWMYTTLPKQRVSVPLHRPEDRHSLTVDPTSIYPLSHVNMAVAPKEVWVPIFLPLGGVARSPHEMTAEGRERVRQTRTIWKA